MSDTPGTREGGQRRTERPAPAIDVPYDELPVVKFLRLANWSEDRIAEVVAAHRRGETYKARVTVPAVAAVARTKGKP